MTAWGVTICFTMALGLVACSDDGADDATPTTDEASSSSTTSTTPERPASTTTTAFDPASVKGQVEAAYLKSWDVYADAVYDLVLDEDTFAEIYAEEYLETVTAELERRIRDKAAALVRIDHDYTISVVDESTALVVDEYRNHQVLIDAISKKPIENDPDKSVADAITLKLIGGHWRVVRVQEFE